MTYRLTRKAEQDVIDIYLYGFASFGPDRADAYHRELEQSFQRLAEQPYLARERGEIDPPVRVHPCGAHLVIYTVGSDRSVLIVRVRHRREDWIGDPEGPDIGR